MDFRAGDAAGSRTSPARAGWTGRSTGQADSGRVARLKPARAAAALLPVLTILAACLTGQAQAQTEFSALADLDPDRIYEPRDPRDIGPRATGEALPWSTTMTVGEKVDSNLESDKLPRGYVASSYGSLADDAFTHGTVDYTVRIVWVSTGTVEFTTNETTVFSNKDNLVLEIAGEVLNFSDIWYEQSISTYTYFWETTALPTTHGFYYDPNLSSHAFHDTLPKDAMVTVCLRTSTQVCGGSPPTLSTDATLSALALQDASDNSAITLSPGFSSSTTSYTASEANDVDEITVLPTVNESNATYEIQDGDGTALVDANSQTGFQVALSEGDNTVKVEVTAEDTTTETYTVVVTRERPVTTTPAAPPEVTVPNDWSLIPSGLGTGDKFRLIFLSSTKTNATSYDIADYNDFIQGRADVGHTDIQSYSDGFRAVGCTADSDARDNTATTGTGVRIHWLNGNKVADNYGDFKDGDWDEERNNQDRNELGNNGPDTSNINNHPYTGCKHDGTESITGTTSYALGAPGGFVRTGRPNSTASGDGPLSSSDTAGNTFTRPMYGLSQVFEVAAATAAAGVTVSETALTVEEQDTTGETYTVVLDSEPTSSVTVTVAGHASTAVSAAPASLTFTTSNWSTARTVTVTAGNDTNTADETVSLTHAATGSDSDYTGIMIAGVTVEVEDNDTAKVTGVMLTPGDGELAVEWVPVANATGYQVQWKSGGQSYNNSGRQATIGSGSTASHTISGLANGTTYTVRMRATRTGANNGPYSDEAMDAPEAVVTCGANDIWCATLTVQDITGGNHFGCANSQSGNECSTHLTNDDFTHALTNYSVSGVQVRSNGQLQLFIGTNDLARGSRALVLHVGSETFEFADADAKDDGNRKWNSSGLTWTDGGSVVLRLTEAANSAATGAPVISGTAQVGMTLTAAKDTITDADGTTKADNGDTGYDYSYQWVRVDADGMSNETDISGATLSTYTLATADLDKKVKAKVSFLDDGDALETRTSAATVAVVAEVGACPAGNDWCATMTVEYRDAVLGKGFIQSTGTGSLSDIAFKTFTVREIRIVEDDGVVIFGLNDYLSIGTVFNLGGTDFTADAAAEQSHTGRYSWAIPAGFDWIDGQNVRVSVELANFPAEGAPTISGTAQVDETLTAAIGDIADTDGLPAIFPGDYTFQWLRVDADGTSNETDIGTDSETYTPVAADVGKKVKVQVGFTDDEGTGEERTSDAYPSSGTITAADTATDPVWSATMTVEVHTGSSNAWGYGLYNYGGTPDPSQNYGSLDDTTFTLGTNDFAISKLEARDSTNSLNENVFLRIEGTGLTDPTGLTLEWGGAELSLDDTSSASSGAFYWRRSDNKLPSTSPLAPDNIRTTLVPGSTVKACLRTSTQTCPDTSVTATVSTDATLSDLTLEDGSTEIALSPEFVPATGVYTATVYNQTTALTLTAEKNDSNATVVITNDDDSSTPGEAQLDLSVGSNTLTATVTAQSGATKTYTITVTRAAAPPAPSDCPAATDWCTTLGVGYATSSGMLSMFEEFGYLANGNFGDLLSTTFSHGGTSYTVSQVYRSKNSSPDGNTVLSDKLSIEVSSALPDGTVFQLGSRTFTVDSDSETNTPNQEAWDIRANPLSWTAGQNVTVSLKLPSDDATLSGLALKDAADDTAITLTPSTFVSTTKSYTADVANDIDEITVEPTSDHNATFAYLNASDTALTDTDTNKAGFQATLLPGANTIKVKVTAQDGNATDTYTVVVTRAMMTVTPPSGTALVSNVGQTDGDLGTLISYDQAQAFTTGDNFGGYALTSVEIQTTGSPTLNALTVSIRSDSSGSPDASLGTLTNPGSVASDGIATFTASGAGIDLERETTYFVMVDVTSGTTGNIQNTASDAEDAGAAANWSIGNGSLYRNKGETGAWLTYAQSKKIRVNGTAKAGVASTDADLTGLALKDAADDSTVTLAPVFATATKSYTADVGNDVAAVTVEPARSDSNATVAYLDASDTVLTDADTNTTGFQTALFVGATTIKVKVTAEDDATTETYTVVVTREAATGTTEVTIAADDATAIYNETGASFTVTRTGATTDALDVVLALTQSNQFLDAGELSRTVTIAAGSSSNTLSIAASDLLLADTETRESGTLTATVLAGTGYSPGTTATASVAVVVALTVSFDELSYSVDEGVGTLQVTLLGRTGVGAPAPASAWFSVSTEAVNPPEAVSPEDYGAVSVTVEIPASAYEADGDVFRAEVPVDVEIVDDARDEPDERLHLSLAITPGLRLGYSNFTDSDGIGCRNPRCGMQIEIMDNDATPTVTLVLTPPSITEDGGVSQVTATLDHPSSEMTTIQISAAAVSPAVAGDFALTSLKRLTVQAGDTENTGTGSVALQALDNAVYFGNKSVTISGTATNVMGIVQPQAQTVTIEDDEEGTATDATLSGLALKIAADDSTVALSPVFAPATTSYTAMVEIGVDEITVAPTENDSEATVAYLDGSDTALADTDVHKAGFQAALAEGANTIKVKVTAADRATTGTYTVVVTRQTAATDAALTGLALKNAADDSAVTLIPGFATATKSYTADVANTVLSITVEPAKSDSNAAVAYLDAGDVARVDADSIKPGFQVALKEGENTIKVQVTAEDGHTTETYTVVVTRELNTLATGQPEIAGAAQMGRTLTAELGTIADIDGLPDNFPQDYDFQWVRVDADGVETDIFVATSSTYTPVAADLGKKVKVEVSFTAGDGSVVEGPLPSDATSPVVPDAASCGGSAVWCSTLTVEHGTPDGGGDFSLGLGTGFGSVMEDFGSLLSATFTHLGTSYTVTQILADGSALSFATSPNLPDDGAGLTLDIQRVSGTLALKLSDRDSYDMQQGYPTGTRIWYFVGSLATGPANPPLLRGFANPNGAYRQETDEGTLLTVSLFHENRDAEGTPTISGTAQVGGALEAGIGAIADADGLPDDFPEDYTFQWVRVDADGVSNPTNIGVSAAGIRLAAAEAGKKIKVEVSFTDDGGSVESLTSDAFPSGTGTTITLPDGNLAPVFNGGATQSRTLAETVGDATAGTAAGIGGAVSATDANSDPLNYSLGGTHADKFDFDDSNGQISTKAGERYDYEVNQRYSVTVTVTDGAVSVSAAVTINITNNTNETPPAPAAPTVTPTSGSTSSLDVSWTAPDITGRPIITGYDLQYRVDGESSWTDGPQDVSGTDESIPGLTAGTAYEVQVRALNDDGDGAWSDSGDGDTTPPTPTVRFGASAYTAIEGVAGAVVTVLLDPAASRAVTIPVTTDPQGGASSADYSGVPRSVTFAAGETEQTFTVTATEDTVDDDGESLQLGFGVLPSGVLLGSPSTATVALVQDADVSTWYVWFGESSYTVTEGGTATISVHLNSPWKPELNEALTVPLFDPQHRGGASADDYSGLPESVTFQPGQTRASFTLRVTEDSDDDDGESVLIGFRRLFPDDLEVGRYGPHKTTLHIADNDGEKAVTVSFATANYTAAEGGATATVRLRLDAAPGRTVTIELTKTHREATAADYSGVPGSVTFGASEKEKSFTVTATDDSADDDRESVAIGFGSLPSKVSAGSPSEAVVQLTDNDHAVSPLVVGFDASAGAVRDGVEEGGGYRLGFRLTTKPDQKLTIPLTYTYLGGATAADFTGLPAHVTFEKNATSAGVTIRPVDDFEDDPGESLKVSFGTLPAGVSVSSWSGRSTIIPVIDNDASPGLSVSDASAREWPNKKVCLLFKVTMDLMDVDHEVSVNYATANGTAVAGQDFKPISGTLVFRPSESRRRTASKSLCVEVLDDSHDEGVEEMTLVLSNPVRAYLADGTGTGYISNTDKMPGAWLTRFGRAATDHVVEAVGERWQGGPQTPHLTLGGRQVGDLFGWAGLGGRTGLGGRSGRDTTVDRDDPVGTDPSSKGWLAPSGGAGADIGATAPGMTLSLGDMNTAPGGPGGVEREAGKTLSGRAAQGALLRALGLPDPRAVPDLRTLLMGSSFFYSAALDEDGESRSPGRSRSPEWLGEWSAWGRTAASRFSGADGNLTLDGEVATAMLGFDSRWDRWLAGVAVSFSEGRGAYTHPTASGGAVATTMTGLNPYARFELNERTSFWGVLGYGVGDLSLTPARSDTALGTELANAMAAFGGRTALSVRTGEAGRFELALRSDARLTNTVSESIESLVGTAGRTGRVRLMLEGSGSMPLATGAVLKPKLEAGLRYDTGDAETGAGLEVGGGLGYAAGRLSVEVNARGLLAHRDTEYEEWGFSGSIAYTPSKDGRGLSMRLGSAWGATQSGVQSLWSRQDASGLVRNGAFEAAQRYQVELRYGLDGNKGRTRWEPFVGVESGEGASRALRLGVKLTSGRHLDAALVLGQRQGRPGADPEQSVQLRGVLRW